MFKGADDTLGPYATSSLICKALRSSGKHTTSSMTRCIPPTAYSSSSPCQSLAYLINCKSSLFENIVLAYTVFGNLLQQQKRLFDTKFIKSVWLASSARASREAYSVSSSPLAEFNGVTSRQRRTGKRQRDGSGGIIPLSLIPGPATADE